MYISDLHEDVERPEVVKDFLHKSHKKAVTDAIEQIVESEFERLEDYADEFIADVAARRATKFLDRVLKGDKDAAMSLMGDRSGGSRIKQLGCDHGEPWAHLIHGSLFETDAIELRRKIVEAHVELLRDERIADLESIVAGLTKQVRELDKQLGNTRHYPSP